MGFVEQRVFQRIPQPATYRRYIDDNFVITTKREALDELRRAFEENSVLHFTCEFPQDNVLPFLDVKVTKNQDLFSTSVYRKPTNTGLCLNDNSECPEKFKYSMINSYTRRALTRCSNWNEVHRELDFVTQQLVDNGYSNLDIQFVIKKTLDHWYNHEKQAR